MTARKVLRLRARWDFSYMPVGKNIPVPGTAVSIIDPTDDKHNTTTLLPLMLLTV